MQHNETYCVCGVLTVLTLRRQEEQAARVLPVVAEEQDPAQRPRGGEEAGLGDRGRPGRLRPLQSRYVPPRAPRFETLSQCLTPPSPL